MFNNKKKVTTVITAAAFALSAVGGVAFAQRAGSAEAALYKGADRQQHLIDGAKKEGELLLYTSLSVDDLSELTAAFEKKYGIKVKVWRSGGENVVQRAVPKAAPIVSTPTWLKPMACNWNRCAARSCCRKSTRLIRAN
jgi:iron(III) transport system substrate-binding protein